MGRKPDKTFWTSDVGIRYEEYLKDFVGDAKLRASFKDIRSSLDPEFDQILIEAFQKSGLSPKHSGHWQFLFAWLVVAVEDSVSRKSYESRWKRHYDPLLSDAVAILKAKGSVSLAALIKDLRKLERWKRPPFLSDESFTQGFTKHVHKRALTAIHDEDAGSNERRYICLMSERQKRSPRN